MLSQSEICFSYIVKGVFKKSHIYFAGDEHAVFHLRAAPRCLQPTLPVDSGADRGSGGDSQPVQKVSLEGGSQVRFRLG